MKRFSVLAMLSLLITAACQDTHSLVEPEQFGPSESLIGPQAHLNGLVRDKYIVTFVEDVGDVGREARRLAAVHGGELGYVYEHAIRGFSIQIPAAAAAALARNPVVHSIEPVYAARHNGIQSSPPWSLDRIDQPDLPLNARYSYDGTGYNYTAYVMDTGVRTTHVEFEGRATTGWTVPDGAGPIDCHGHGTHVAGTVGGKIYGVAKQVRIVSVRIYGYGTCSGSTEDFVGALDWIIVNRRMPAVVNNSNGFYDRWGNPAISPAVDAAVNRLIDAGIAFVTAAGNEGVDACLGSPARVPRAITVAATSDTDRRASFSNFGSCVDIFAPGVAIASAGHRSNTEVTWKQGTSMAAPHVAGAIAYSQFTNPIQGANMIVSVATANKVADAGTGTPNRLLYTGFPVPCECLPPRSPDDRIQAVPSIGPYTGTEGLPVRFEVSNPDPTLTYTWDFGDLTTTSAASTSHTYRDNDSYVVQLTVADVNDPSIFTTKTTSATISNAAPIVSAGSSLTIVSGQSVELASRFSDPGAQDSPWLYQVDWGDQSAPSSGSVTTQGNLAVGPHRFFTPGTYTVLVTVKDKDGGVGTDVLTVTVAPVAIPVDVLSPEVIRLRGKRDELIQVAVLSTAEADASQINVTSVTLGDGLGDESPVAVDKKGQYFVRTVDLNGDGRSDRLFSFLKSDLIARGDLTLGTKHLVLQANLIDRRAVRGTDEVRVEQ